jgi:signal transduction histidine kinase
MIEPPSNAGADSRFEPPTRLPGTTLAGLTRFAWMGSIALGGVAFAGWWLRIPALHSGWPSAPHLSANGALIFVLLGLSLAFMENEGRGDWPITWRYRVGQLAAFLAACVAALILLEYVLKRMLGIDELIFKDPFAATYGGIPGRPSFPAALNGILLGLGAMIMDLRFRRIWLAQALILTSLLISVLGLIGHLCDVSELYAQAHTRRGNGLSLHDILGFMLLAMGLLCARPDRGLVAVIRSQTPGGLLARWLLLAPVIGLLLSGVLYVTLERETHSDSTIRVWALGLSNLVFLTVPIWVAAQFLHQVGLERDQAHHVLEERVRQRTLELTHARDRLEEQATELERRVAERTAKLRETIGDLEAFSYSVAHDMRAPLRGMEGFARLLLEEHAGRLDADAQEYLDRIASSAARMDLLIQDVLNYTRVLQTQTPLVWVDLDRLIHQLIGIYPQWQPPKADIRINGPFPPVTGHEGFLTQCISNLVGNAVKFVAPGTTPQVRIWAEYRNDHVLLCIQDNGIGIAPKDRERVFRMFERLNPSQQYEGTGIGLTIVRKAAERMGGRVGFESELGKGSTFWIELKQAS